MAASEKQSDFPFELDGGRPAKAQPMSVRLTGGKPTKQLSRQQKKFGQLLKEVEKLRARQQRITTSWERFLSAYLARVHPEEQRQHDLRKEVVRQLATHLHNPGRLGPRQREALADLIAAQLDVILDREPELTDPDLVVLIEHFKKRDAAARASRRDTDDENGDGELDGLPPFVAALIRDSGLDPAGFRSGMSPAEIQQEIERQMMAGLGIDDFDPKDVKPGPTARSRKSKDKRKGKTADPREQAEQVEAARKRTLSVIYKQLAKALHPDLETDPTKREQKHHLMQELTTAYKQGDLHTLLRLELAWIQREEDDLDRLTDEKLKVYIELLQQQVADLREEVAAIPYQPHFATVSRFVNPFTGEPDGVESILANLRPYTESLTDAQAALQGPAARTELRDMIRAHIAQQKAASRLPDFRMFGL
ncbi:hypothetical protein [Synoicihabitans lomoniglobus]|uniref:Molecular chaperone DnaJ n=1 Tax=Synoicihabitans lomoniglobus TaxID=2909285 RepID=A0AAE9ZX59_9BACT|nr:hypothetical protein [Opitutaceae bacterium LMO-M01]WED65111.1 hypothetical protein PXH66_22465 [Opitutaceae bacterium LMO-M01]